MSVADLIIVGAEFNPATQVKYSKPKVNASGGKSVGILNAKTNTVLNLSTPLMLTWGFSEYVDDKTGKVTYDLSLQFPSDEYSTPATSRFLKGITEFETKLKADAIANCKEWFNKPKMTADAVDALWTPILKYPKNKDMEFDYTRAPTLRCKVPYYDGEWKIELYDIDNNMIYPSADGAASPKDLIAKGSNVAISMQCGGIWFANGKFGVTWKLFQAIVKPKTSLRGKCHIRLGDDEKQKLASQVVPTDVDAGGSDDEGGVVAATVVSDDEDDAPAPQVKVQAPKVSAAAVGAATPVSSSVADDAPAQKKKIVRKKD